MVAHRGRRGKDGSGSLLQAGLIGHSTSYSWSPAMHAAAFAASGIAASYELWNTEPADLAARIDGLRGPEILGANVTIPYKTEVLSRLDAGAKEVGLALGAVNTIVREETDAGVKLIGCNTDVLALQRILGEEPVCREGRHVLVVGAGGAARAALAAALDIGLEPWIASRRPRAGQELLEAFVDLEPVCDRSNPVVSPGESRVSWVQKHVIDLHDIKSLREVLTHSSVVIQATPVGTNNVADAPFPVQLMKQLPHDAFVFDMVYNPPVTALVREALVYGLRACGGLQMLLYQGALAFTLWTGLPAPIDQMRAALAQQATGPATTYWKRS
jgi:shikimate dehydrogenase